MVKLLYANIAEGAVLGAGGLGHVTCVAPSLFIKEQLVESVAFYSAFQVLLRHRLSQATRIGGTSHIIAPVASEHAWPGNILMVLGHVRIRNVLEAICDVKVVPSDCQEQVETLDERVSLEANPPLCALE